jgi:hypothetical protein
MKVRTILSALMLFPLLCAIPVSAPAQTTKPTGPSHQQTADAAARKQLAGYLADFRAHPEDAALRDKIIELAKTLKPAPAIPQLTRADFGKAAAQLKNAAAADDFKAAAKLFEQVAVQAPWYADAYLNAASAYAKAADYDSAKRNLTLYMAAVRTGVDTQKAEGLQSDMEQQQAAQKQQQALQQFQQALQQFQANPNDAAREQIIKLAQAMKTPPAIPEEAREHYAMAQEFAEKAKIDTERAKSDSDLKLANDGFERAVAEYKAALLAAPCWADVYKRLAIAQKAAAQYDDAIASLNLYLLTQPADARDAQDEIYKLKADKQTAALAAAQAAAGEQQRQREAQIRDAPKVLLNRLRSEYNGVTFNSIYCSHAQQNQCFAEKGEFPCGCNESEVHGNYWYDGVNNVGISFPDDHTVLFTIPLGALYLRGTMKGPSVDDISWELKAGTNASWRPVWAHVSGPGECNYCRGTMDSIMYSIAGPNIPARPLDQSSYSPYTRYELTVLHR